jgi:predicted GNAT family N-acyltransferase
MTQEPALLRWAEGDADLQGALAVRLRVFCEEQGVPAEEELDGRDEEALHLVAVQPDNGEVVGTLRLLFGEGVVKVGRVAVAREWRRRAIAGRMLEMALTEAGRRGFREARLASQVEVIELYREAGFEVQSQVFIEAGIPHVWMGRTL